MQYEMNRREEETVRLSTCAIAEVKHISLVPKLHDLILGAGFHQCNLQYLGGLRVLLECPSMDTLDNLVSGKATLLSDWFAWIKPWNRKIEEDRPGRIVWLNFEGVPLHAWHAGMFVSLGEQWGSIVEIEDLTLMKKQLQRGRVSIFTTKQEMIHATVNLLVEGCSYMIRATEDLTVGVDYGDRFVKERVMHNSDSDLDEDSEDVLQSEEEGVHTGVSDSDSTKDETAAAQLKCNSLSRANSSGDKSPDFD